MTGVVGMYLGICQLVQLVAFQRQPTFTLAKSLAHLVCALYMDQRQVGIMSGSAYLVPEQHNRNACTSREELLRNAKGVNVLLYSLQDCS